MRHALGPGLEVGIERLRAYITQKVRPLDAANSVQEGLSD